MTSLSTVLALTSLKDLPCFYITGTLGEEIYMQQPHGFHSGTCCNVLRLVKSFYELEQLDGCATLN